jgi:hypothetical protein
MSPEEPAFIKRCELEIINRMEQLPEADQHVVNVLSELRVGLYVSDSSERRGDPSQWYRDKGVIGASLIKEREERGRGNPLLPNEDLGRIVEEALARLRE